MAFGYFEYLAYGKLLIKPLIIENLPDITIVRLFKAIFCINLFISYPLMLNVANVIIEQYLYGKKRLTKNKRMIYENINRTILVIFTIVISVAAGDK
jgi:hypothetical protein